MRQTKRFSASVRRFQHCVRRFQHCVRRWWGGFTGERASRLAVIRRYRELRSARAEVMRWRETATGAEWMAYHYMIFRIDREISRIAWIV